RGVKPHETSEKGTHRRQAAVLARVDFTSACPPSWHRRGTGPASGRSVRGEDLRSQRRAAPTACRARAELAAGRVPPGQRHSLSKRPPHVADRKGAVQGIGVAARARTHKSVFCKRGSVNVPRRARCASIHRSVGHRFIVRPSRNFVYELPHASSNCVWVKFLASLRSAKLR